jgi:hypothetical protein
MTDRKMMPYGNGVTGILQQPFLFKSFIERFLYLFCMDAAMPQDIYEDENLRPVLAIDSRDFIQINGNPCQQNELGDLLETAMISATEEQWMST